MIDGCATLLNMSAMHVYKVFTTDSAGSFAMDIPVPTTQLRCGDQFVMQGVIISPSGPLVFGAATNGLLITLGS
jgi:hypothetical protein